MFKILTVVLVIVSLIAITKAVRYETRIKKIQRCAKAFFDDLDSGRTETKTVDDFLSEIRHALYD